MNPLEHALAHPGNEVLESYLETVEASDFRKHVAEIEEQALKDGTDKAIIKDAIDYLQKFTVQS